MIPKGVNDPLGCQESHNSWVELPEKGLPSLLSTGSSDVEPSFQLIHHRFDSHFHEAKTGCQICKITILQFIPVLLDPERGALLLKG
jgi:hypothetical protein